MGFNLGSLRNMGISSLFSTKPQPGSINSTAERAPLVPTKNVELPSTYGTSHPSGGEVTLDSPKETKEAPTGASSKIEPSTSADTSNTAVGAAKDLLPIPVALIATADTAIVPQAKPAFCFKPVDHDCHDTTSISLTAAAGSSLLAGILLLVFGFIDGNRDMGFAGAGFAGAGLLFAIVRHIHKSEHNEAKEQARLQERLLPAASPV